MANDILYNDHLFAPERYLANRSEHDFGYHKLEPAKSDTNRHPTIGERDLRLRVGAYELCDSTRIGNCSNAPGHSAMVYAFYRPHSWYPILVPHQETVYSWHHVF